MNLQDLIQRELLTLSILKKITTEKLEPLPKTSWLYNLVYVLLGIYSIFELKILNLSFVSFRYDEGENKFYHSAFNFYTFPRPNKYLPDQKFLSSASSIDFLINHGFDFNKAFKDGISYLNIEQQNRYKELLKEEQNQRTNAMNNSRDRGVDIPPGDAPIVDEILLVFFFYFIYERQSNEY